MPKKPPADFTRHATIEPIRPEHDRAIRDIIKSVGEEFGAIGEGFGPSDAEVERMSQYYKPRAGSVYFVLSVKNKIYGGGGLAPFDEMGRICELRKLFLMNDARGYGFGLKLTEACLAFARQNGYQQCYLDTLSHMTAAIHLYEKLGFRFMDQPLEGSIHSGCDVWMMLDL